VREPIATFSLGAWLTPFDALVDPRPQVVMAARSPSPEDTRFDINFGAQRNNVGLIHFQRLMVSQLATIRVRLSNDPNFTSTTYDSGVVSGWPVDKPQFSTSPWGNLTITGQYEVDEYMALGMPRYFIPPAPVTATYCRVNIADVSADVPAQIGCFGCCEIWQPIRSLDLGWSTTFVDESDIETVPYGSRYILARGKRRRLNIGFSSIRQLPSPGTSPAPEDIELMQRALGWVAMMGRSTPLAISIFPDDTPNLEKRTVWGTLSDDVAIDNPYFATYRMSMTLEQLI